VEENEKAVDAIIARIKTEKVEAASLQRVKTKLRAALIRKLDNNSGLAREMCFYEANFGDWRRIFTELDDYNKITADDVQRVAKTYLVENSRTVAYTYAPAQADTKGEPK
jgi:predicted Zn-dependent peptidase